jgi:hypothetical protein
VVETDLLVSGSGREVPAGLSVNVNANESDLHLHGHECFRDVRVYDPREMLPSYAGAEVYFVIGHSRCANGPSAFRQNLPVAIANPPGTPLVAPRHHQIRSSHRRQVRTTYSNPGPPCEGVRQMDFAHRMGGFA